jgi:hypothetical protein
MITAKSLLELLSEELELPALPEQLAHKETKVLQAQKVLPALLVLLEQQELQEQLVQSEHLVLTDLLVPLVPREQLVL